MCRWWWNGAGGFILETYAPLARLFASLPGIERLVIRGEQVPPADLQCPLQSLPRAFGTELATIPARVPYLRPPVDAVRAWAERFDGRGLRVGLVWAGNPAHGKDRERSIPFDQLAPLWAVESVRWYSLQVGLRAADLDRLGRDYRPAPLSSGVPRAADRAPAWAHRMEKLSADLTDFAETAAAITALDLVIAVDTSVAHLAGALGRDVWLLIPTVPDWRWMLDRDDSPWYPTMRLFRQTQPREWSTVLTAVAAALSRRVEGDALRALDEVMPVG